MIYVDNAQLSYRNMKMSHLVADTDEELLEVAAKLGLSKWIQNYGTHKAHLDLSMSKRKEAIRYGAKEVSSRELVTVLNRKRNDPTGEFSRAAGKEETSVETQSDST